jgi:hypothetical protein
VPSSVTTLPPGTTWGAPAFAVGGSFTGGGSTTGAAAWFTTKTAFLTVIFPVRARPVFWAYRYVIVAGPLPAAESTARNGLSTVIRHLQPFPVVTVKLPLPASAATFALVGESVNRQGAAASLVDERPVIASQIMSPETPAVRLKPVRTLSLPVIARRLS